ncbi:MAG: hypothetical protein ABDH63_02395 [Candidatus Caldarchaeales archaeon]
MKVRLRIPVLRDFAYEVEVEDPSELKPEALQEVHTRVLEVLEAVRRQALVTQAPEVEGWFDLTGDVPHMGRLVRDLPLKDQILLAYYAWDQKGRKQLKPIEVYEFLRNDGFPVNYGSVVARIAELTRDGLLIREADGTYRLSRYGTERAQTLISPKPT